MESAANEAVCMYDEKLKFDNPSADEVNAFITSAVEFAQKGDVTVTETGKNTLEKKYKTSKCIMFRTYNTDAGEYPIHTSMFSTEDMKITDHPKVQINSFPQSSGFRYGGINRNRN